jgi:hypothetical protein
MSRKANVFDSDISNEIDKMETTQGAPRGKIEKGADSF